MSEVEKQESQKTVVAFISGLLIGGLLVWVFSSTPENTKVEDKAVEDTTEQKAEGETSTEVASETKGSEQTAHVAGEGAIGIVDQSAGMTVAIESLKLPVSNGWVVVREYTDGEAGNTLGAARFSIEEGLTPTSVELIRATTAGKTYQAVFFTNEGAKTFSLAEDKMVDGIATTFSTK